MTIATLREKIISEFRLAAETGRTYPAPQVWDVDNAASSSKAMAECLANAIIPEVSTTITFLSNVINFFDPSSALPADPVSGDRYIASATGNGWTLNYIYEYNGATWDETIPAQNECVWVTALGDFYTYNGTIWTAWGMAIDHGSLTGLADDDHTQYYNQTRGDARYEKLIGNPTIDGQLLARSTAGVWSWVSPTSGYVPTTRQIIAGTGLTGGGDLTADRTLAVTGILATFYGLSNAPGWLHNDGSGNLAYTTPSKSDVGLGNVENTALSTWAGSTSITTLGTITTGVWNGSVIGAAYIADLSAIYQPLKAILTSIGNLSSSSTGLIKLTNGVASLDATAYGTGSVTSVAMTVPTGLTISGSPITTSGTLGLSLTSGYSIPTTANQTNWSSAYTFTNGFTTNYPDLVAIEALSGTAGFLKKTAANTWTLDNSTYLTGNQTITLSGDISGSGATSITTTLPTVNSNVGTYQGITVNAKGQVTAAANQSYLTSSDLSGYLPLTAGSGKALTGNLYGIGAILSGTADNAVQINNAISTTYAHAILSLNSLCATSGYRNLYEIGYASSSANTANFGFCFQSSGSTSNFLTMGLYGYNDLLKITAAGVATFSGSVVTPALTVSGFTSVGFVKSSAAGVLSVDTSTYLTANQSITLSGAVTGSGTTAITAAFQVSTAGGFLGHSGTTSSALAMITSSTQYHVPIMGASSALGFGYLTTNSLGTNVVAVANGGTNIASYTVGDILYASATTTLSKLADVATGSVLLSGGTSTAPSWGKASLTTCVSGILPVANGGTGLSALGTVGTAALSYTSASSGFLKWSGSALSIDATTYLSTAVTSLSATTPIVASASTGAVTLTHATSGATAGTYKSVTVNTYGHVTGGTNPATLAGYGITDAAPLTHGVSTGYIPYATSTTTWGSSPIQTDGSHIGIGTGTFVNRIINIAASTGQVILQYETNGAGVWQIGSNCGSGTNDNMFSIYSSTYGVAHSYAPILTCTNTGNVGIGTPSPTNKLHVVGSTASYATIYGVNSGSTGLGVLGEATAADGIGLEGYCSNYAGLNSYGVKGYANGYGGYFEGTYYGVCGKATSSNGYAVYASGHTGRNVTVKSPSGAYTLNVADETSDVFVFTTAYTVTMGTGNNNGDIVYIVNASGSNFIINFGFGYGILINGDAIYYVYYNGKWYRGEGAA
jgi:hypothetical protein